MTDWAKIIEQTKRLIRNQEVKEGKYCEHLPLRINDDDRIINSDGKNVCNNCCDHSSNGFGEPFINKKGKMVCDSCCQHEFTEETCDVPKKHRLGVCERYCLECLEILPPLYFDLNNEDFLKRERLLEKIKMLQEKRKQ